MITKEKKSKQLAELTESFKSAKAVFFTEYKGLTVAELAKLRTSLKEVNGLYKVAKNTLCKIASKGTPSEQAKDILAGPTGIAFAFSDPVAVAKKTLEFASKNDKFKLKSGIVDGKLCTAEDIDAISKLPSREVLLSMLAGVMNAPATKLAVGLNATIARFAYALEALRAKKEASSN